jgi:hypothetical protein
MSDLKVFLRVLKSEGYPNPEIQSIAKMVGYDLDNFLLDLKNELGDDGVVKFCDNAIDKLSGKKGMKVDLETDGVEYVVVEIYPQFYDEDESQTDVISRYQILDSKIFSQDEDGNDTYKTIKEIEDEIGMGEWAEFDEMMDHVKMKVYNYIHSRCGFGIWFE